MNGRAPLTEAEKRYIYERKLAGTTYAEIAGDLGCSPETVRKWWQRHRRGEPQRRRGRPRRAILSTYPDEVRETCIELKRTHMNWGPTRVRLEVQHRLGLSDSQLPSNSRLSALFKARCPEAVEHRRPRQRRGA